MYIYIYVYIHTYICIYTYIASLRELLLYNADTVCFVTHAFVTSRTFSSNTYELSHVIHIIDVVVLRMVVNMNAPCHRDALSQATHTKDAVVVHVVVHVKEPRHTYELSHVTHVIDVAYMIDVMVWGGYD